MLTAIIIDDETSSRNALRQKIANHCPDVVVIADCENGETGIESIEAMKPDIIFLDVEMPRMNGFTMLQQLKNKNFEVIFITAYDHYAIKAIKFSALDYLLKPVEVEDLKMAVEKVTQKKKQMEGNNRVELLLQNFLEEKTAHQRIAISSMEGSIIALNFWASFFCLSASARISPFSLRTFAASVRCETASLLAALRSR